jgi:hypothetical protein
MWVVMDINGQDIVTKTETLKVVTTAAEWFAHMHLPNAYNQFFVLLSAQNFT